MVQNYPISQIYPITTGVSYKRPDNFGVANPTKNYSRTNIYNYNALPEYNSVVTTLSPQDTEKYIYLVNFIKDIPISLNSNNTKAAKQLEILLRNGKLLNRSPHDSSTTLDNLYNIAVKPRVYGLNAQNLISNALDILNNPKFVTQNFGNIPDYEKQRILSNIDPSGQIAANPNSIDIFNSGVCPAASSEVNMADKYPSEFVRWLEGLSGENKSVILNCSTDSISENNPLGALSIVNLFKTEKKSFNFNKMQLIAKPDDNAYVRACIQNNDWDFGERNVADVLIQSAIMQLGTQNTYNSLTDTRAGEFSASDKGLIELEKTYVESLIKNKNITSLIYQNIDDNKNIISYNCPFETIEKHIKDTIDSGDDVIVGIVLTNQMSGICSEPDYNPLVHGGPNEIINGHEITIVDYKLNENNETVFVCIDTDDDNPDFVEYKAKELLPRIHHGGYPSKIVETDLKNYPGLLQY